MFVQKSCCALVFVVSVCFISVNSLGISDWGRCKITLAPDDLNSCLSKAFLNMINSLKSGSTDLGIPPFEPFTIKKMDLKSGGKGPVNMQLLIEDLKMIRITEVSDLTVDASNLKDMSLRVKLTVPVMNCTGKYKMSGRILAVPVKGEGETRMYMSNNNIELLIGGKSEDRGGKTYWKVDSFDFSWLPADLKMDFTGLFNGDKQLGAATNKVLNDNWKLMNKEFAPFISSEFAKEALPIANIIAGLEPFNEMFPQ